jgi:predicted nucleic acid-binding Zn ribbon protein
MFSIQQFSSGVLAEVIRRQPPSAARTMFAWQLAVGPAIARVTTVSVLDGVLQVNARDADWERAVERASQTILARMQHLLGAETVTSMKVVTVRP